MVFTTTGAAAFALRPDTATLDSTHKPSANAQETPANTTDLPRPANPIKLEASNSARNNSHIEQEVTVNGRNIPVPENGETRRTISEDGNQVDITIDSRQQHSTGNSSSGSTHISTDVRVTQEGGD